MNLDPSRPSITFVQGSMSLLCFVGECFTMTELFTAARWFPLQKSLVTVEKLPCERSLHLN